MPNQNEDLSGLGLTPSSSVSTPTGPAEDLSGLGLTPDKYASPLGITVQEAIKTNPDQYAKDMKLSKDTGVPVGAIEGGRNELEQKARFDAIDINNLRVKAPKTSEFLQDYSNAVIAQDDIDVLQEIESVFNVGETFQNLGESAAITFESQYKSLALANTESYSGATGLLGLLPGQYSASDEAVAESIARFNAGYDGSLFYSADEDVMAPMEADKNAFIEKSIGELRELSERQKKLAPEELNIVEEGVRAGVDSLINMAPGVAAMLISRGKAAPALVAAGTQTFGSSYGDARVEGLSPQTAAWYGSIDATIEVATEVIPTQALSGILTGGRNESLGKKAMGFLLKDLGGEQLATLGQSLNAYLFGLDEEIENAESMEEVVSIQLRRQAVTAVATVVAGGAQASAASGINKVVGTLAQEESHTADRAQVDQNKIDTIDEKSAQSKLKERDPELYRQFLEQADVDNNTNVFIDGVQLSLYLKEQGSEAVSNDPALRLLNEVAESSRQEGNDASIPVADYATILSGTEHSEALRPYMALAADTVAPARAEESRAETERYVETLVAEAQENTSQYVEAQEIYEDVKAQLIDSGQVTPRNAGIMAQIVPAWATSYAARTGKSVAEVYADSGLTIEGSQTGRRAQLEGDLDTLRQDRLYTENQLIEMDIEDLDRLAFGVTSGQTVSVTPDQLTVVYPDDLENPQALYEQRGDEWVNSVDLSEPIEVSVDEQGNYNIEDGHHRYFAAQKRGETLQAEIEVKGNPVRAILARQPQVLEQTTPNKLRDARGYYDPANVTIRLNDSADLSTFLHEFAHFMFEMEKGVDSQIWQDTSKWFLRNSREVAREATKSLKRGRAKVTENDVIAYIESGTTGAPTKDKALMVATHEQFARGFEKYLMEGEAPSTELRNVFRTISQWLGRIYQSVKGNLRVNLDSEMSQVFDRILATDEQIEQAKARARVEPLFTDATMAGMTEEQYTKYLEGQQKAVSKATETLREKMIKQLTRTTKKWWREERDTLVDEEKDILSTEPVYAATAQFRSGDLKLDTGAVRSAVGEMKTDKLGRTTVQIPRKMAGMTASGGNGVHPDEAAALFGFSSGSEMLASIIEAPTLKAQAESNADARMIAKYGEILTDGTIEREADIALQNEDRGELMLTELRALTRGTNQAQLTRDAIRSIAENRIGKLSFRQIFPAKYRKAEIKAAQEAAAALALGNVEGAAAAKMRQAVNFYLGMEATKAREGVTAITERMARYNKKSVREAIQKAEGGYWEQLVKILERFEFRKAATIKSVDATNQDIQTWMRERTEGSGDGLVLTPAVLNELYISHWKNVPYEELQGINDSVKNIEHVARYSNKINLLDEELTFKTLVNRITDSINNIPAKFSAAKRASAVEKGDPVHWAMSGMSKIPFISRWLDGGEFGGITYQTITQRIIDADKAGADLMETTGMLVVNAINDRSKEDVKRHNTKIFIPEIDDHLYGHQILAVALNTGNAGNLRKMLLGEQWANPDFESSISFENEKLQAVLSHMTKDDWTLVQFIWDQMDNLYPQLSDTYRRSTGQTLAKVEAVPVETTHGTFRGGYYPVKYDYDRSQRPDIGRGDAGSQAESMFASAGIRPSATAGAANERTGFYDPILLGLDVIPSHFTETIHYITHHEPVRDLLKLFRNRDFQQAVDTRLGKDERNQFIPWLRDIATDGRQTQEKNFLYSMLDRLRTGMTMGVLGFSATTGLMQVLGLSVTASEVGVKHTLKGVFDVVGHSRFVNAFRKNASSETALETSREFVFERSAIMKQRAEGFDREVRAATAELKGARNIESRGAKGSVYRGVIKLFDAVDTNQAAIAIREAGFKHIALIQLYTVDLPTWMAAYDMKIEETGDERAASQFADAIVEATQGSGETRNLAALFRNQNSAMQIMTMFMTAFSSMWNVARTQGRGLRSGDISATSYAAKSMFLFTVPFMLEALFRGDLPDSESDEEEVEAFAKRLALYPLQLVPFMRDIASGAAGEYGYNISPVASLVESGISSSTGLKDAMLSDDEITVGQAKGVTKFAGAILKVPGVTQIWRTGGHAYDVMVEGEELTMTELALGTRRE